MDCNDVEKNSPSPEIPSQQLSFKQSFLLFVSGFIATLFVVFGQDYFENIVLWLDRKDDLSVCLIFIFLYLLVAFPLCWGYLPLNLVAGYRFGLSYGIGISLIGISVGVLASYVIIRFCCKNFVQNKIVQSSYMKSTLMNLIVNSSNFKIIVIARLTPVPYGLQNAVFAVCDIGVGKYLLSSILGLTPILAFNVYIGSTFRSMQDIFQDNETSATGYLIFLVQVVLGILIIMFVVRKARIELNSQLEHKEANELDLQL